MVQSRDDEGKVESLTLRVGAQSGEDNSYVVISSESPYYARAAGYSVEDYLEKTREDFLEPPPTPTPESSSGS